MKISLNEFKWTWEVFVSLNKTLSLNLLKSFCPELKNFSIDFRRDRLAPESFFFVTSNKLLRSQRNWRTSSGFCLEIHDNLGFTRTFTFSWSEICKRNEWEENCKILKKKCFSVWSECCSRFHRLKLEAHGQMCRLSTNWTMVGNFVSHIADSDQFVQPSTLPNSIHKPHIHIWSLLHPSLRVDFFMGRKV